MKKTFINAVLAGIMIGLGAIVFLSVDNHVIGSDLFAISLLSICCLNLNLYTGKIGYVVENHRYLDMLVIWLGNFTGTFLVGRIIRFTRIYDMLLPSLETIMSARLTDDFISLFILAVFCGILMYTAVEIFRTYDGVIALTAILLCVSIFILSEFEHSIANMVYFTLYGWSTDLLIQLIVVTVGNSIGGILIPLCKKVKD